MVEWWDVLDYDRPDDEVEAIMDEMNGLRRCLDQGADVDAVDERGYTLLRYASQCGDNQVVKLALDRGAAEHPAHLYIIINRPALAATAQGAGAGLRSRAPLHASALSRRAGELQVQRPFKIHQGFFSGFSGFFQACVVTQRSNKHITHGRGRDLRRAQPR